MSARSLKKSKKSSPKEEEVPQGELMERFHDKKVCDIIATNTKKKEDIFAVLRPKTKRECMNYNISQTDTKMDAGPTKIHIEQTRAKYEPYPDGYVFDEDIPPPPPKKRKRPSHGRGPVWLFMDEEWKRKVEAQQAIYKKEMEERLIRKAKILKLQKGFGHEEMLRKAGPDWFQELSPSQLSGVDALPISIAKDSMRNTIFNTQDCLARLGLFYRPNHRYVDIALKHCCGSPVEFLLILYQLIDPRRTEYSLNDKLLLSAVVHLSMRSVLRELHIRIPSPPPRPETKREKKKPKQPYIRYKSPYLLPYTFEPPPPKHTGIYKNRHIQYPESPYFSYLDELRQEMKRAGHANSPEEGSRNMAYGHYEGESVATALEREIDEELATAQQEYDNLPNSHKKRKLLRPSLYKPCETALELFGITRQTTGVDVDMTKTEIIEKDCGCEIMYSVTVGANMTDEEMAFFINIEEIHNQPQYIISGITIGLDGEAIPIIAGVIPPHLKACRCFHKQGVPADPAVISEESLGISEESQEILPGYENCVCGPKPKPPSTPSTVSTVPSFEKRPIEEPDPKDLVEKLVEVKPPTPIHCGCRDMVDIVLEGAKQKIECMETCGPKNRTLIIADTKLEEEDKPIPIIAGVKAEKKCTCLEKYNRVRDKYEELRARQEAYRTLRSCGKQFQICGVTTGPDGKPIYVLSGLSSQRQCKVCLEVKESKLREEDRLAHMPDMSQLHQRYVISGVYNSPAGNVYVLSGVAPTKDCECMKIYNAFIEKHALCMEIYERYIRKMEKDTEEYMAEVAADPKYQDFEPEGSEEHESEKEQSSESTPDVSLLNESEDELKDYLKGICLECNEHLFEEPEMLLDEEEESSLSEHGPAGSEGVSGNLKRFIVLNKIPCKPRAQEGILKKALTAMGRDCFPLANLPDVHKLPHFKLWMAMRCGQYWTMEDRERYYFLSKKYWHHLDVCYPPVRSPRLQMSNREAWTYTWRSAKFVKKVTKDCIKHHCRTAKQDVISDGREFFPSMFDYIFPTKTFRDVYFAYIPSKEEATFSFRPWKVFDYKDFKLIRNKRAMNCP